MRSRARSEFHIYIAAESTTMISDFINTTVVAHTSDSILIEEPSTPYPLWHLLFWVSPYFAGYWGGGWFLLISYIVSKLTASGTFSILIARKSVNDWIEKLTKEDDPYDPNLLIEFFQADFYPSFLRMVSKMRIENVEIQYFLKLVQEIISNWSPKTNIPREKKN